MSRSRKTLAAADAALAPPRKPPLTDESARAIAVASLAASGFVPAQIAEQLGPEAVAAIEAGFGPAATATPTE
ncbi:MAG: hypothetical protein U1C74_25585 [Phenylobacterium sp.]|nr:hypothetical protein [Phenylobacterium sp.]